MRFNRVVFGNTSSPFLLNATVKHHLSSYPEGEVVKDWKRDMYVDNWFCGADTVEEVARKYNAAYDIMAEANMSLEKVSSNSIMIASKFKDRMQIIRDDETNTVLGLKWCNNTDTFSYCGFHLDCNVEVSYTKKDSTWFYSKGVAAPLMYSEVM